MRLQEITAEDDDDEARRLAALRAYAVLDTDREVAFDDLADLAAAVCDTPMAAISLVDDDRQWFKAETGLGVRQTDRSVSFCSHALDEPEFMEVRDATTDPRFADNPLVTGEMGVRFYAGAVLRTPAGEALGAACVIDTRPRPEGLTPKQRRLLVGVARQAMSQLELRRSIVAERAGRVERDVSDARLQAAMDAQLIGSWVWHIKTDQVFADARFAEFYNVDPALAVRGVPLSVFLEGMEEADRPGVNAAIRTAVETGEVFAEEYRLRPPAGSAAPRWVLARGRVIYDADGEPDRFPGAVVDITDRRRVEDEQKSTAAALQVALKAGGLGRWDHNPAAGTRYYDDRLREMFGLEPGEDRDFDATLAHVHPDDRPAILEGSRMAIDPDRKGGFEQTFRVIAPGGGWRWIEATGRTFFQFGKCVRFTGVMRDVSDRVQRDLEQVDSALRLQLALDAADVGTWSFDPTTQAVEWDSRTRRIFDVGADAPITFLGDFIGRLHPDDQARALERITVALSGLSYHDELRVRLPSGADRWIGVRGGRSPGESAFIGTLRDITAEKAMEAQRRLLAEELRHRMKNMLAMVQSIGSQTLRTASSRDEARRIFAERLVALGGALDTLTERTWTAAPLRSVIDAAVAPHDPDGRRVVRGGEDLQLAAKPALALTLALHELATNAVKYGALSTPAGQVDLSWRVEGAGADALLIVQWRESGGPPVTPPAKRSFGSRLIESNVGQEFAGTARIAFEPTGVIWRLEAPLAGVTED
ncbi:PAS domain-containing protein [soil metagenome]